MPPPPALAHPLSTEECASIEFKASNIPAEVEAEQWFWPVVSITNATNRTLSSEPPYPVHLAYHWVKRETGDIVVFAGMRSELFSVIEPGTRVERSMVVFAPPTAGAYLLLLTLVQETVRWFTRRIRKWFASKPSLSALMEVNFLRMASCSF